MAGCIFNRDAFYSHLDDDKELASEILEVYLVDAPERLESLLSAMAEQDQANAVKYAHALKGISATIRAERMTVLAEKVEQASRKGDLCTANSFVALLGEELELVLESVNECLKS
ncbi:Hpt domain-containing protein [Maridesulfovibrio sp. FT414]|uniref:Hpt domain-containing protein n=1 Tax=Maridesulfovibrio sp. FT414 TaxID=2979469 RepID=UPI003D807D17